MEGFEVVPGSVRCYATTDDGTPTGDLPLDPDAERERRRLDDERERELRRLVARGEEAEARLESWALQEWRRLRSTPDYREYAHDPAWTEADQDAFEALRSYRRADA